VAGAVTIAAGTTLTVPGTLTLTSGTLNQAGATARSPPTATSTPRSASSVVAPPPCSSTAAPPRPHRLPTSATGALPNVDINDPLGTLTLAVHCAPPQLDLYRLSGLTGIASTVVFTGQTITGSHTLLARSRSARNRHDPPPGRP